MCVAMTDMDWLGNIVPVHSSSSWQAERILEPPLQPFKGFRILCPFQGSTEPLNIGGLPPVAPPPHLAEVSISRGQPPPALDSAGGTWPAKFFQAEALPKGQTKTIYQVESKGAVLTFKKKISSISKKIQVLHLIHHLHPSLWVLIGHGLLPDQAHHLLLLLLSHPQFH